MLKYLCIILVSFVITGCSPSKTDISSGQTISFDRYIFKRSQDYTSRDPVALDNQQIVNQVLGVYELAGEDFSKNLIISSSKIKQGVDGLQFMTLNASKLSTEISGLISDGYSQTTVECDDQELTAYIHQLHLDRQGQTHYMLQLYLVDAGQGYILSAYTDTQADLDSYRDYFNTLTCN